MKTLFAAALTSAVLLVSPLAFSDHHMKDGAMGKGMGMGMDKCMKMGGSMMEMVDTNKDGKISRDEFNKHHEQMFTQMDKNADGSIDATERAAMKDRMKDMKGMGGMGMGGSGMGGSGDSKDHTHK